MTPEAVTELVLLAALAGTVGVWVVLRRLAFYSHAVGTATFPGLVVAGSVGMPPAAAALGSALLAGAGVRGLRSVPRLGVDAATGVVLATALALGALAAGDAHSVHVEELLFGALGEVGWTHVAWTALAVVVVLGVEAARRRAWLADGLDDRGADALLLGAVAIAVIAAVSAVGALLAGAILVVPPAIARLLADDLPRLRAVAAALALGLGLAALALGEALGQDPAALLAVGGGLVYALVAVVR